MGVRGMVGMMESFGLCFCYEGGCMGLGLRGEGCMDCGGLGDLLEVQIGRALVWGRLFSVESNRLCEGGNCGDGLKGLCLGVVGGVEGVGSLVVGCLWVLI